MTPLVGNVTTLVSLLTIAADIFIGLFVIALFLVWAGDASTRKFFKKYYRYAVPVAFLISLGAPIGSLFYSQVAGFEPCELCWWQRIFSYPLVIILALTLWYTRSKSAASAEQKNTVTNFALTLVGFLAGIGALIAIYHSYGQLLNPDILPACAATCVSCAKLYFLYYGYVVIPTMSLTAFLLTLLPVFAYKIGKK